MRYLIKRSTKSKEGSSKLILFDIDQTLATVFEYHELAMQKTFGDKLGVKASYFDIDFEGKRLIDIFKEIGEVHEKKLSDTKLSELISYYTEVFVKLLPEKINLLPGVEVLIKELSKKHTLGVITGGIREIGETILKRTGIYNYFKTFTYGDEAPTRAEMVKKAIEKSGEFDEVVVIGDSINDINSTKANNVKSIAVNTGHHSKEKLLSADPDLFVKDLTDPKVMEFLQ